MSTGASRRRRSRGLETNTLVDRFFHLVTGIIVVVATTMLAGAWQRRDLTPPWRAHVGLLLAGWGAFDVVEGLIDRQILGIHHVRDDLGAPLGWDIGFLAFGVALIVAGSALLRSGERLAASTTWLDHHATARSSSQPARSAERRRRARQPRTRRGHPPKMRTLSSGAP